MVSTENSKRPRPNNPNRLAIHNSLRRNTKKTKETKIPRIQVEPTYQDKVVKVKVDRKAEEELRNEGKVLCGSLHPKNGVACTLPVDEHGDKHSGWKENQGTFNQLQWNKN